MIKIMKPRAMKFPRLLIQLETYERKLRKYQNKSFPKIEEIIEISCYGRWSHVCQQMKRVRKLIAKEEAAT